MIEYREFSPTGFDVPGLCAYAGGALEDKADWLVGPCGTDRDASLLTRANWESFIEAMVSVDPEKEDHEGHSFGHWACGHFEIVLIRPDSECARVADEIEGALADYPVLDDGLYSRMEHEEACVHWSGCSTGERIEYCKDAGVSVFAARRDEMETEVFYKVAERLAYC